MSRVVILGGGIAGMSAAHELIERGFRVDVYDAQEAVGKIPFPEKDTPDSVQFPSSQAFQVFAGFSRHTFDVMRRTPIGHGRSVADNLLLAQRLYVTKNGSIPLAALNRFPSSRAALRRIIRSVYSTDPPLKEKDLTVFSDNLWQLFTSCKERRKDIYERIRWAQFMAPISQTEERAVDRYQTYLIRGLARLFVHAPLEQMSAKMGGDLILHLLLSMRWPECKGERILNGTLNDAWLAPWYKYLEDKGVQFHAGSEVVHLHCDAASKKITHATLRESQSGKTQKLEADFFICAVPVTEMSTLINPEMVRVDETLADIQQLAAYRPLNEGIQYYLRQAAAIPDKHIICLHTPWELSVTAPHQFWPEAKWVSYGNGNIRGMLAVTISAWDTPGFNGKSAYECSFPEVVEEVWDQLERTFNTAGPVLSKEMRLGHISFNPATSGFGSVNHISRSDSQSGAYRHSGLAKAWHFRPEASGEIQNLLLAADYVRTNTDFIPIESANEAARRAVNTILLRTHSKAPWCTVWDPHEQAFLTPRKWLDQRRYRRGRPWSNQMPLVDIILQFLATGWYRLTQRL